MPSLEELYRSNSVVITGGTIDGVVIGGNEAAVGTFTTLTSLTFGVALSKFVVGANGEVNISGDNQKLTLGASDAVDSYLQFNGTNLQFYDSVTGAKTLAELAPGGSDTQIQFNNSGAFGGSSSLVWNGSGVGIGGAPIANIPITLRQTADSNALRMYGYDDKSSAFCTVGIGSTGRTEWSASDDLYFAGASIELRAGSGEDIIFTAGDAFIFRDRDGGYATRAYIDSAATPSTGRLVIPEDATNSIVLGAGNDASIGFDGTNLVIDSRTAITGTSSSYSTVFYTESNRSVALSRGDRFDILSESGGSWGNLYVGTLNTTGGVDIGGGVGIGGVPVADYPLTAYQTADSKGIKLFGYDDKSTASAHLSVLTTGAASFIGSEGISFQATTGELIFRNYDGSAMNFDSDGLYVFRDEGDSYATRLYIDSAATPATGRLVIPEDATNSIVLGAGNDATIGFDGSELVFTADDFKFDGDTIQLPLIHLGDSNHTLGGDGTGASRFRLSGKFGVSHHYNLAAGNFAEIYSENGGFTDTDGEQAFLAVLPFINQSSTANYVGLLVDVEEYATGSGNNRLLDLRADGVSKFTVDNGGDVTITGGLRLAIVTATTTYNATVANHTILCNATSAAFNVNLPAVATSSGLKLNIKKIDSSANAVTIDGNASETIDGATTQALSSQYESLTIQCDGSAWYIL